MPNEIALYNSALNELQIRLNELLIEVERLTAEPIAFLEEVTKLASRIDLIASAAEGLILYPEAMLATRH